MSSYNYNISLLIKRFLRKAATHALNSLQETREEFMNKYL